MSSQRGASSLSQKVSVSLVVATATGVVVSLVSMLMMTRKTRREEESSKVIVAVGTLNAGKISAVKNCLKKWKMGISRATIRATKVPSEVSEQPMTLSETTRGAMNRARNAFVKAADAFVGIGLESGLAIVDGTYFDFCSCSIYDGNRYFLGVSSMFALPKRVVEKLEELGYNGAFAACGVPPDPTGDGVTGVLSNGILTRPTQMSESVDWAMLQYSNRNGVYRGE